VYVEINSCGEMKIDRPVCRKYLSYDLRPHNIDVLRYCLGTHDWGSILNCADIQCAYDLFLETVKFFIQTCIPAKLVRLGKRDPDYISPLVKVLLNKRNKFRRQGNRADSDKLASVIDKLIANNMRNRLR
jgi:hypothetical protein